MPSIFFLLLALLMPFAASFTPTPCGGWLEQFAGPPQQNNDSAWKQWLDDVTQWRTTTLLANAYDGGTVYSRSEFQWTQRNIITAQAHPFDLGMYRVGVGYTIDDWVAKRQKQFGGLDSLLLWPTYPNIGIDNRNQFDWVRSLPGGLAGLRSVVYQFQNGNNISVLLPYNPWDTGTRREDASDGEVLRQILDATGARGINGDTMQVMPQSLFDATQTVMEPELGGSFQTLNWTMHGWGYWIDGPAPSPPPCVDTFKWLENRRVTHVCNRWGQDKTTDLQYAVLNGDGYVYWENVWGIWNGITPMGEQQIRRAATVLRYFESIIHGGQWFPMYPTLVKDVFASQWVGSNATLFLLINRAGEDLTGAFLQLAPALHVIDCYHGSRLPSSNASSPTVTMGLESLGFGCLYLTNVSSSDLDPFLTTMKGLTAVPLAEYSNVWVPAQQTMTPKPNTPLQIPTPPGMVTLPAGQFLFNSTGVDVENGPGGGFQFPWETEPSRGHVQQLNMPSLHVDIFPVTNADWKQYLLDSSYSPKDPTNYLLFWDANKTSFPSGDARRPVTWVSLSEASAYCAFYGKRLPHAYEWQYAAQGPLGFSYPWGNTAPSSTTMPLPTTGPTLAPPDYVDAHPAGASKFSQVQDLVGNVWQWTDDFQDGHTHIALVRGGSYYRPTGSQWYFPLAIELTQHNKYLLMDESYNRAGTVGFRCVVDVTEFQPEPVS